MKEIYIRTMEELESHHREKFIVDVRSREDLGSKRNEIKQLIRELRERSPYIEKNIFRSVENVNLNTIISYKDKEGKHSFLDRYFT